jgi:hypothetical protein
MVTLDSKVLLEKEFHNLWARSIEIEDLLVRESFEAQTAIEKHGIVQFDDYPPKGLDLNAKSTDELFA